MNRGKRRKKRRRKGKEEENKEEIKEKVEDDDDNDNEEEEEEEENPLLGDLACLYPWPYAAPPLRWAMAPGPRPGTGREAGEASQAALSITAQIISIVHRALLDAEEIQYAERLMQSIRVTRK